MIQLNEEAHGFSSKDYSNYKPYKKPDRNHSWKDDFELDKYGDLIPGTCHACDYRKTSCISPAFPRYYCRKDDPHDEIDLNEPEKSVQQKLI